MSKIEDITASCIIEKMSIQRLYFLNSYIYWIYRPFDHVLMEPLQMSLEVCSSASVVDVFLSQFDVIGIKTQHAMQHLGWTFEVSSSEFKVGPI